MNIVIDIVGLLLVAANVALGIQAGLLRRVFALLGLFAGLAIANAIGNGVARFFYGADKPGSLYADAWSFIIVTAIVTLAIELLGLLYHDRISNVASLFFDRGAAAVVGAMLGFLEIAICCVVGLAVSHTVDVRGANMPSDRQAVADNVRNSFLGGRVNTVEGAVRDVFAPVLPSDLPAHLAESVHTSAT